MEALGLNLPKLIYQIINFLMLMIRKLPRSLPKLRSGPKPRRLKSWLRRAVMLIRFVRKLVSRLSRSVIRSYVRPKIRLPN